MEEKISKSARKAVLHFPGNQLRAAGEAPALPGDPPINLPPSGKTPPYPAGMPLRPDEIQRARGRRPRSVEGGEST